MLWAREPLAPPSLIFAWGARGQWSSGGRSWPRPWGPQFSVQDGAGGKGTLAKGAGSQGGVWVRAKGTGGPTEARRGGPKGGVAQPGRQGEPALE